jgi:hypothetical protein
MINFSIPKKYSLLSTYKHSFLSQYDPGTTKDILLGSFQDNELIHQTCGAAQQAARILQINCNLLQRYQVLALFITFEAKY